MPEKIVTEKAKRALRQGKRRGGRYTFGLSVTGADAMFVHVVNETFMI